MADETKPRLAGRIAERICDAGYWIYDHTMDSGLFYLLSYMLFGLVGPLLGVALGIAIASS